MKIKYVVPLLVFLISCSCQNSPTDQKEIKLEEKAKVQDTLVPKLVLDEELKPSYSLEKNGIVLKAIEEMVLTDVSLDLKITNDPIKPGVNSISIDVEGVDLASKEYGIQIIQNNGTYASYHQEINTIDLIEGNNVILAVLSNKEGQSLKKQKAFLFQNIEIGEENVPFDIAAPHLIYNQPRETYSLNDRILVDFYLINTQLSEDGMKVKLSIDETEFIITQWNTFTLEGLEQGVHKVRIELIDREGNYVMGPFNDSGEREFQIQ